MFVYLVENSLQNIVCSVFLEGALIAVSAMLQNSSFEDEFYLVLSLLF